MESIVADAGIQELSIRGHGFPRDFLQRFDQNDSLSKRLDGASDDSGEVEPTLGLSLGGFFGVDPKEETKLSQSSSIAWVPMLERDLDARVPISRTCSLPAEREVEVRKRKEMQSLKRMEAKRKRTEKRIARSDSLVEEFNGLLNTFGAVKNGGFTGLGPASQGSSGSSGLSDSDGQRPFEVPQIGSSSEEEKKHINLGENRDLLRKTANGVMHGRRLMRGAERSKIEEMPCVATKGDGPDGRRIEGFLYKYRKVDDVRIVCVRHGSFLTPVEFVKHAGGNDVAHPLRHIVVGPSPSALF